MNGSHRLPASSFGWLFACATSEKLTQTGEKTAYRSTRNTATMVSSKKGWMIVVQKLVKSGKDRVIGGVCGGIAAYLRMDSTLVRLVWVALSLMDHRGFLVYLLAALLIPEDARC